MPVEVRGPRILAGFWLAGGQDIRQVGSSPPRIANVEGIPRESETRTYLGSVASQGLLEAFPRRGKDSDNIGWTAFGLAVGSLYENS